MAGPVLFYSGFYFSAKQSAGSLFPPLVNNLLANGNECVAREFAHGGPMCFLTGLWKAGTRCRVFFFFRLRGIAGCVK